MTADGIAGEVPGPDPAGGDPPDQAAARDMTVLTALALCDAILGEVGRRSHLFGWLRDTDKHWIPVDAYYPAHRLVVICRRPEDPDLQLYDEIVPAHDLRLLVLDPDELEADDDGPQALIEELLADVRDLRPPPPREPDDEPRENPVVRAMASFSQPIVRPPEHDPPPLGQRAAAAERAARFVASRHPHGPGRPYRPVALARPHAPAHSPARTAAEHRLQPPSFLVGLALAAALGIEVYFGVVGLVLSGHLPLAFGLALDCVARALGTIAAARTDRQDWVWLCVLGGSPAVATFALFHPSGPVDLEPAPLAGLLALLASAVIVVVLVGMAVGL